MPATNLPFQPASTPAPDEADSSASSASENGQQEQKEWAARLQMAKQQAIVNAHQKQVRNDAPPEIDIESNEDIEMKISILMGQVSVLKKKASTRYIPIYFFLLTGAAVFDLMCWLDSGLITSTLGPVWAAIRWIFIKNADEVNDQSLMRGRIYRTAIGGAIKTIPLINLLPANTAVMFMELGAKRRKVKAANQEISAIMKQIANLQAGLSN